MAAQAAAPVAAETLEREIDAGSGLESRLDFVRRGLWAGSAICTASLAVGYPRVGSYVVEVARAAALALSEERVIYRAVERFARGRSGGVERPLSTEGRSINEEALETVHEAMRQAVAAFALRRR